jgi:hypothetical protein
MHPPVIAFSPLAHLPSKLYFPVNVAFSTNAPSLQPPSRSGSHLQGLLKPSQIHQEQSRRERSKKPTSNECSVSNVDYDLVARGGATGRLLNLPAVPTSHPQGLTLQNNKILREDGGRSPFPGDCPQLGHAFITENTSLDRE